MAQPGILIGKGGRGDCRDDRLAAGERPEEGFAAWLHDNTHARG
jgi:hypothetical protein